MARETVHRENLFRTESGGRHGKFVVLPEHEDYAETQLIVVGDER